MFGLESIYAANKQSFIELFPVDKEPNKQEWTAFFALSNREAEDLWAYHLNKSRKLKDWSWQWRVAWIRKCQSQSTQVCSRILSQALADPAMVVRSEAVETIATRFENTNHNTDLVVSLLEQSYHILLTIDETNLCLFILES